MTISALVPSLCLEELGRQRLHLIDEALTLAANYFRSVILRNPLNPHSFQWFGFSNVVSKTCLMRGRAQREGLLAGLVQGNVPFSIVLEGQRWWAVERDNREIWTQDVWEQDKPLKMMQTEDGCWVTSDIDLVTICPRKEEGRSMLCRVDEIFGQASDFEREVIERINKQLHEPRRITHGPAARFDRSKRSHLHFPMGIYIPDSNPWLLGREEFWDEAFAGLQSLRKNLISQGYDVPWNPMW